MNFLTARFQLSACLRWSMFALAAGFVVAPCSVRAEAASLTIDDFKNGVNPNGGVIVNRRPGATGRAGRDVRFSGTAAGGTVPAEASCEYASDAKVESAGGSALKWSPLSNVSVNAGRWVGTADIPLSKDWIVCRVRASSGEVSNTQKVKWGVGIDWLWVGQSNFSRAYQIGSIRVQADSRTQAYTRSGWHPIEWPMPAWDSQSPLNDNARIFANLISKACDCLAGILPFASSATSIQQWMATPINRSNTWWTHANLNGDGLPVKFTSSATPGAVTVDRPSFHVGQFLGFVGPTAGVVNSRRVLVTSITGSTVTLLVAVTGKPLDLSAMSNGEFASATGLSSPNLVDHDFEGAIWQQGENNAGAPQAAYYNFLVPLWHQFLQVSGRTPQQLAFGIVPMGTSFGSGPPGPNPYFDGSRQAQLEFIDRNAHAGAFFAGSMMDATHVGGDGVHAGVADYGHLFARLTQSALHASGLANHGAAGPKVASAKMAIGSNTVTVTVAHDAGTGLQDSKGNPSASDIKGFRVLKGGKPCPIASAAIGGPATIVLQTKCTRGALDAMTMDYAHGDNPYDIVAGVPATLDSLGVVYDNAVPLSGTSYADTLGTPLQPTRGPLSIAR